ncbi:4-hydroxyphenylpyruvate dioxygenase [Limnohabitans sp. T6-5]|uniref:IclR family transcriptional regulator domain-containing protein n=1 Tax=Limnohabitans sp. T6-5 TaxID=1100724 RepID=UPI000D34E699|nr:IclR family transcriptional regulator C-terminal domain-containing protein [Limnohabitans sp. T6-5]PUE10976.1 4-hydroxyphenylpyruvate dioxygenase [Limnohabitans sp. T6-5]
MPAAEGALAPHDWIAGLEKGLHLIEAFDAAHPRLTATEMGARCGMTRTAARRYLKTLAHLGYVGTDGKLYWLMPRILRLGHAYIESARLPRLVQPVLQRITSGTEEIAYLGVLDGDDTIFIARSGLQRHTASGYMPGTRMPAQVTAAGMVILACGEEAAMDEWLQVHELRSFTSFTLASKQVLREKLMAFKHQGWAVSEQQLELNFRGIAVPLLDRKNVVHGAISLTMPINREETDHALNRILPVLQEAARSLRPLL